MKIKKQIEKLNKLDMNGLLEALQKSEQELFGSRLNARVGKVNDFSVINKMRKEVARIKTIINQRVQNAL